MSLKLLSNVRISLKDARREAFSAELARGALLSGSTFANDVLESDTASCRVSTPVKKRLTPAMETLLGKVAAPFKPSVLSARRPPQPVWLTELAIAVEYRPT